jgi:hypothetical protein
MLTFSRRTKVIVVFVVVVAVGYGVSLFWEKQNKVPANFVAARSQGAIIAQNIVSTSDQSTDTLAKIDQYDQKGDYADALTLTQGLVSQSKDLKSQALDLSTQIASMTQALSGVKDFGAQQDALEAISGHLALINQLINYSGDLSKLLSVLQAHFNGQPGTAGEVEGLVTQINLDINAINNFNNQASQAMVAFDKIEKN